MEVYELYYYFTTGIERSEWYADTIFGFDFDHATEKLIKKHTFRSKELYNKVSIGNVSDFIRLWYEFGSDTPDLKLLVSDSGFTEGEQNV